MIPCFRRFLTGNHNRRQLAIERFADALQELPELSRQAFIMNKMDGLTHAEIAVQLGISEKSVQRTIIKAFNHCIKRLAT